ncbi:hypothetical protein ABFS83_01G112800 [Erythranthe nasuta]
MEEQCEHPITEYERVRASRIKENMEKMRQLGININNIPTTVKEISKCSSTKAPKKKQQQKNHHLAIPRRASSRLTGKKGIGNEAYSSSDCDKASSMMKTEEVYNSEHEKLLGDCKNPWMVSDDDNKPLYDPINGITCHQCRQKTLGLRTDCNLCRLPHGRLCGTCLYKRYGENLLEATENTSWACPVCRGICNCSRCRQQKGFQAIGNLHTKAWEELGFKSVAHYLIQTRRAK